MPHIIVEYTANLEVETQPLMRQLQQAMVATGAVNLKGLKCRAIRLDDYLIADGYEGYQFLHVNLVVREGRTLEVRQDMAKRVMAVIETAFGHLRDDGYLSLSVDVREMPAAIALTKHNIPIGGVPH